MDYQLSHAYQEAIETRSALEALVHDLTGNWPLPTATARDMCDTVRAAFSQRESADRDGQRAFDWSAE